MNEQIRFEGGEALRSEAERRIGRKLTRQEWDQADPEGSFDYPDMPYDANDLHDLLNRIRQGLPNGNKRPPEQSDGSALLQRTADAIESLAQEHRQRIFGTTAPPFPELRDAAAWIEGTAAQNPRNLTSITLTLHAPAHLLELDRLRWIRDWLVANVPTETPMTEQERKQVYLEWLQATPAIRSVSGHIDTLPYPAPEPEQDGFHWLKRVRVEPGTVLDQVHQAATEIVRETEWQIGAAVAYLLTGRLFGGRLRVTPALHWSRRMGTRQSLAVEVAEPDGVTDRELLAAARMGKLAMSDLRQLRRLRARSNPRRHLLLGFLQRTPAASWRDRFVLWNEEHPDDQFSSHNAMRAACNRARRRS